MSKINLKHLIPVLLILIGVQIAATLLSIPVKATGATAFGDPEDMSNPFVYLGMVILITAIMLGLAKLKIQWFMAVVIKFFFLITVWASIFFVLSTIVLHLYGASNIVADYLALSLPIVATVIIWQFPEWYVIDTVGLIMCTGVTAIIGVSFGIVPLILLLIIFAVYDAVSVYKTRHMLSLAELVLNLKLPALFIIPKGLGYSYMGSTQWEDLDNVSERQSYIIGMGDIIFPSTMIVSASVFLQGTKLFGLFTLPAIGAMVGSWIGLVVLQWFASKYPRSHAGLPFLNAFTLVGFAVMYGVSMVGGV